MKSSRLRLVVMVFAIGTLAAGASQAPAAMLVGNDLPVTLAEDPSRFMIVTAVCPEKTQDSPQSRRGAEKC